MNRLYGANDEQAAEHFSDEQPNKQQSSNDSQHRGSSINKRSIGFMAHIPYLNTSSFYVPRFVRSNPSLRGGTVLT